MNRKSLWNFICQSKANRGLMLLVALMALIIPLILKSAESSNGVNISQSPISIGDNAVVQIGNQNSASSLNNNIQPTLSIEPQPSNNIYRTPFVVKNNSSNYVEDVSVSVKYLKYIDKDSHELVLEDMNLTKDMHRNLGRIEPASTSNFFINDLLAFDKVGDCHDKGFALVGLGSKSEDWSKSEICLQVSFQWNDGHQNQFIQLPPMGFLADKTLSMNWEKRSSVCEESK
jgi:hypothetical protein